SVDRQRVVRAESPKSRGTIGRNKERRVEPLIAQRIVALECCIDAQRCPSAEPGGEVAGRLDARIIADKAAIESGIGIAREAPRGRLDYSALRLGQPTPVVPFGVEVEARWTRNLEVGSFRFLGRVTAVPGLPVFRLDLAAREVALENDVDNPLIGSVSELLRTFGRQDFRPLDCLGGIRLELAEARDPHAVN